VIRARNLPVPIFPDWADLKIPKREGDVDRSDQPWRSVLLEIRYLDLDGSLLQHQTVDFSKDWNGNGHEIRRETMRISVPISPWGEVNSPEPPLVKNYDMKVNVIRPSARATDKLEVKAFRSDGSHFAP